MTTTERLPAPVAAESRVRRAPLPLLRPALGPALGPVLLAVAAAAVRIPYVGLPLGPDEGGYLLVAAQWSPGSSTYGNYFLDRPPLLVTIFGLSDALGGTVPLRLLGILAVVAAVLLAGRLGGTRAAAVAAIFVSTPLFGAPEVDGEMLAVPFVLAGILVLVRSLRSRAPRSAYGGAAAAGALAACAVLVKQNMLDVLVVAAVLLLEVALRGKVSEAARRAGAFVAGGLAALGVALVGAATRGTGPAALWDALVTFRAEAAAVIDASANAATPIRFHTMVVALVVSGAPLVVAAALVRYRHPVARPGSADVDLRWAALALLAWELAGAALGGSYWLHYLVALTPALVLLTAAVRPLRWPWAVIVAGASTAVALVGFAVHPPTGGHAGEVSTYLREHARPGDTVVVGFGHPEIVRDAGMASPYEHLWSLSARVRDPQLHDLTAVLAGSHAPRWVVVSGTSLDTWGIDATSAQAVLDARYREVTYDGDWHVFERD